MKDLLTNSQKNKSFLYNGKFHFVLIQFGSSVFKNIMGISYLSWSCKRGAVKDPYRL